MLNAEIARQNRLKETLKANPDTAAWVDEAHLFQNYKQLQFFDTLALYFNCVPEGERSDACFSHVPMSAAEDALIDIEPVSSGTYAMNPYPFDEDELTFSFEGRYLEPIAEGPSVSHVLEQAPLETQTIKLIAGAAS